MKTLKVISISFVSLVFVVVAALRIFGLNPQDQRPGVWLSGDVNDSVISDWSFSDEYEEIFIQTNTRYGIPHSITTYSTDYEGNFYVFSAYYSGGDFPDDRGWNRNVMRDPNVRIKIGEQLYDRQLTYVSDEATRIGVHGELEKKYPQWNSPGLENVYVFRVDPAS